jgi:hypothetical protein
VGLAFGKRLIGRGVLGVTLYFLEGIDTFEELLG